MKAGYSAFVNLVDWLSPCKFPAAYLHIAICLRVLRDALVSLRLHATASERALVRANANQFSLPDLGCSLFGITSMVSTETTRRNLLGGGTHIQ